MIRITTSEFLLEMREVYDLFEKETNEPLNQRLFAKVCDLTRSEFKAIKTRILEESDFFPRFSQWAKLKSWILEKREKTPPTHCPKCDGAGFFEAICLFEGFDRFQIDVRDRLGAAELEKYVEKHGKTTLNVPFFFKCDCPNANDRGKKARILWNDSFEGHYQTFWNRHGHIPIDPDLAE